MGRIRPIRGKAKRPLGRGEWAKRNKRDQPPPLPPKRPGPPPLPGERPGPPPLKPPPLPWERPTDPTRESSIASDREIGMRLIGLPEEAEELIFAAETGRWIDVLSTYLNRVRFDWASRWGSGPPWPPGGGDQRRGYLTIEFLDLAIVEYPGETYQTFDDLINSPSKGSYMWYASSNLQGKPGNKIRDAQREVTQEMRDKRDLTGRKGGRLGHNPLGRMRY